MRTSRHSLKWKSRLCSRKSKYRNDRLKIWSSLSSGYANTRIWTSLPPYALRELVKAIYIEAPDKSSGKRHQGIRISYDLVGFIPVEELLKQETA